VLSIQSVVYFYAHEAIPMKRLIWNKHTKLVLKHLLGWFCIVVGLIMFITPGQGILTVLIGVYLLADEIPMFGRLKQWINHKFPKTADYVHRHLEKLKARMHREPKS
jgi:hypothetical protein